MIDGDIEKTHDLLRVQDHRQDAARARGGLGIFRGSSYTPIICSNHSCDEKPLLSRAKNNLDGIYSFVGDILIMAYEVEFTIEFEAVVELARCR